MEQTIYTERIKLLRDKVLDTKPSVCTERAKFYTQSYKKYEAMPVPVKRAMALKETLEGMTIYIDEGELIVGNHSSKLNAAPFFPEYATAWMLKELDEFDQRPGDAYYLTEESKEEIRQLCPYWEGKTTLDKGYAMMPTKYKEILDAGIIKAEGNLTSGDAHVAVNNDKILKIGLKGYKSWVKDRRNALELTDYHNLKKEQFYKAVEIDLEALSTYIRRFATLANQMRETETKEPRKKELRTISDN